MIETIFWKIKGSGGKAFCSDSRSLLTLWVTEPSHIHNDQNPCEGESLVIDHSCLDLDLLGNDELGMKQS